MADFFDINWDIVSVTMPPESSFEAEFRKAGVWGQYQKHAAVMPNASSYDMIAIAKQIWHHHCGGTVPS